MSKRSGKSVVRSVVATLVGLVVVGALVYAVRGRGFDRQTAAPYVVGPMFATTRPAAGGPAVYYVTREGRTRSERDPHRWAGRMGRMWFRTVNYGVFDLHARDVRTGEPAAAPVRLASIDGVGTGQGPSLIGYAGDMLWVWNGGLTGYRLPKLEPVWTAEKLIAVTPGIGAYLPDDPAMYKVVGPLDTLVIHGRDARFHRVDGASGRIEPIEEAQLAALHGQRSASEGFRRAHTPGRSLGALSASYYLWRSFERDGTWYAMLSADEAKRIYPRGHEGKPLNADTPRWLYRMPFTTGKWDERVLDTAKAQQVGSERFIGGGFLRRVGGDMLQAALYRDGEAVLVFHQSALGAGAPRVLTRVALGDGRPAWNRVIELAELDSIADAGESIVFSGFVGGEGERSGRWTNTLVFVDVKTGETKVVDVAAQ